MIWRRKPSYKATARAMDNRPEFTDCQATSPDPESSLDLLQRAQGGDLSALDVLMARYLPRIRRWASGRLPRWARDMTDTEDLVQDVVLQTFKRIDKFEARHEGAFQ